MAKQKREKILHTRIFRKRVLPIQIRHGRDRLWVRAEPPELHMGAEVSGERRRGEKEECRRRTPKRVFRESWRERNGCGRVGPTSSDLETPDHRRVPQPLWVELRRREHQVRRSNHRRPNATRSALECQVHIKRKKKRVI